MTTADTVSYGAIACAGCLVLWKLPTVWRGGPRERALWAAFVTVGATWLLRTDLGRLLLQGTGIADAGTLAKHLCSLANMCVLLRYLAAVDGSAASVRARVTARANRYAVPAAVLACSAFTAVFLLALDRTPVPASRPGRQFMIWHAGEPGLAAYALVLYGCWAVVLALCGAQWAGAARRAHRLPLRVGLGLMTAGMAVGVVYALLRIVYGLIAAFVTPAYAVAAVQEEVTDSLLYAAFVFWAVGVAAPATQAVRSRWKALRAVRVLYPLWRDLALAAPELVLCQPSRLPSRFWGTASLNRLCDLFRGDGSMSLRLGRYLTEVHDVVHHLRRQAPPGLYPCARREAQVDATAGEIDRDIAAAAYWIAAARLVAVRLPHQLAESPLREGESVEREVPWMLDLARAYTRIDPGRVRSLADEVAQTSMQASPTTSTTSPGA